MFALFKKVISKYLFQGINLYLFPLIVVLGLFIISLNGLIKTSVAEYYIHIFGLVIFSIGLGQYIGQGRYAHPSNLKKNHRYTTIFSYEHRYRYHYEIIEHFAMVHDGKKRMMVKFKNEAPPSAFMINPDGEIVSVLDMREVLTEG